MTQRSALMSQVERQDRLTVDLFAGPGGWSEGLQVLGVSDVGIEWDDAACRTRKAAGHLTIRADVVAYPVEPFIGKTWGLIASPPCQDFSLAGKGVGIAGDRGQLVWQVLRWADALRPEWIACEQVPPVLGIWQHMAHVMRGWGYRTWTGILNAADYGVPQTRKRAFLLASANTAVQPPEPTHAKEPGGDLFGGELEPWVSMAQALGWGMSARPSVTVTAGGSRQGGPDPLDGGSGARETLRREGRWVEFVSAGVTGEGRPKDPETQPADTITGKGTAYWVVRTGANSMKHSRTGSRAGDGGVVPYERSIDEPAPTLDSKVGGAWKVESVPEWAFKRPSTTVMGDPRIAPAGHHDNHMTGSIRVSTAEASVLQSFPPDYPWQGNRSKQFEQIGNAVPPLLAAHVLSAVTGLPLTSSEVAA